MKTKDLKQVDRILGEIIVGNNLQIAGKNHPKLKAAFQKYSRG
jgi:hypothetical protein